MIPKPALFAAATIVTIAALGCGGKGDSGGGTTDDTAREITDAELSQMVLALVDFGPEYSSFASDEDNGIETLEDQIEDDFDPEDERADVTKFGWASGFDQDFVSVAAAQQPPATVLVGTSINVLATAEGASGYFNDASSEYDEAVGNSQEQYSITEMERFSLDVADDSIGVIISADITNESQDIWVVGSDFRRGRLIATVAFVGTGQVPPTEQQRLIEKTKSLAAVMNDRMASVLAANAQTAAPAAASQ